ncbi:hypothetical protein SISNIDRAFT_548184 [Sistotremastrum niveocremeum HHB9708]|uniref:Uncharacterized protein n=1 Tax=Sistotremastrum niveocremeum HHB9708 TaxID=1314777 RepID=A0A164XKH6_9AGAM|nr:hypothetical protein SISNIDRAFT_548184 [Sistotremastrum niveocremeum HHB9708]
MLAKELVQLKKLCNRGDTIVKAKALYLAAETKTGPGTGYDLGTNRIGMLPICAFLASESLNNDDVSEKAAQAASCLSKKDFEATMNTLKSALASEFRLRRTGSRKVVTFEDLIEAYSLSENALINALEVEELLKPDVEFQKLVPKAPADPHARCTIFYWTAAAANLVGPECAQELVKAHRLVGKTFRSVVQHLDDEYEHISQKIERQESTSKRLRTRSISTSPNKTQHSLPLPLLLRSHLKTPRVSNSTFSSPPGSSLERKNSLKRSADSEGPDVESDEMPSPSKRPRRSAIASGSQLDNSPASEASGSNTPMAVETLEYRQSPRSNPKSSPLKNLYTSNLDDEGSPRIMPISSSPALHPDRDEGENDIFAMDDVENVSQQHRARHRNRRPLFLDRRPWHVFDPRFEKHLGSWIIGVPG